MSGFDWITKKALALVEELPAVKASAEHQQQIAPVLAAAKRAACGALDDRAAKDELAAHLAGNKTKCWRRSRSRRCSHAATPSPTTASIASSRP